MKNINILSIYYSVITNAQGCDILKKVTGKSWHEYPIGTKRAMIIAAIWGLMIFVLIGNYILTTPNRKRNG